MAVEDLLALQTEDELFEQFCTDAATLPFPVDVRGMQPERWAPGQLHIEALAHAKYQERRKAIVESGWLRTAKGDSLTLVARGFFQLERYPSTAAVHQFRLTDVAGVGGVTYPAGTRVAFADNGQEFRNLTDLALPLNGYVDGNWKAEVAGALGNVAAGTVTRLRAPIVGVEITSPAISGEPGTIVTAGRNQETDEQLATRCEDRWGSVGAGGNAAAYRFWVTESFDVDGLVSSITRIKILDNNPYGPGSIGAVIANASGTATGAELTRVGNYLAVRKALGSGMLLISSAAAQEELVSGVVSIRSGYDPAVVLAAVQAALDTYESEFAIGGYLYRSEIIQRVMAVDGVYDFVLSNPTTNVAIGTLSIVSFAYALTAA